MFGFLLLSCKTSPRAERDPQHLRLDPPQAERAVGATCSIHRTPTLRKNNYVPAYRAQSLVENTWKNDAKHKYINPRDWLKFHMVPKSLSKSLKVFKGPSKSLKVAQGRSRSLKVSQGLSRSLRVSQGLSRSLKVSHGIVFH